ncbi:MAG: AAA family ATPase [Deltaproteobacteria bacterium]|nr:AAA family ATPase [Deltaproteobacteria bacterium]MBU54370.1 AAA family ATPase [Deltaproteobacteria bacterium]
MKKGHDLFAWRSQKIAESEAPLAARMRPQTLDEFVGQDHIIGPGRLLRRAIQADQLSSVIFYGPPGTGKTTLARIIANTTKAHFAAINAVLAGVKDIRENVDLAQRRLGEHAQRTILFVDEVHRFNKSQQDALLPWVENGTVILIGATTENPYFEVNKALVSRSRIFQLRSLEPEDLRKVIDRALTDTLKGFGLKNVTIDDDAAEHLLHVANGDARALLNALELAVETTPVNEDGARVITLSVAEESIQRRAVLYDKEGDAHFDTISAFIKSIRGSDPDAALYWLAKMDYAGEDPRFIFRRLLILASEDVGLADPQAIVVTEACAATFDRVGMPEGRFHLAQATLYLANTEKSNTTMGYFDALNAIQKEKEGEVPNHLKDGSRDKKGFGHGSGYLYPHSYRDHWVAQQYLPNTLQGQVFYQPSTQGWEGAIQEKVARQREAQLAAVMESESEHREQLTYGPKDGASERWIQRTLGKAGERIAAIRERIFDTMKPMRHDVILDLNGASGLLSWEALRQVPEGGVYTRVEDLGQAKRLGEQAAVFPSLLQPHIFVAPLDTIDEVIQSQFGELQFEHIIARNACSEMPDKSALFRSIGRLLRKDGHIVMSQIVPRETQRLYELLQPSWLGEGLYQKLKDAEEAFYEDEGEPSFLWNAEKVREDIEEAGLSLQVQEELTSTQVCLTSSLIARWFSSHPGRPTYADRLAGQMEKDEIQSVQRAFESHLKEKVVPWKGQLLWITC